MLNIAENNSMTRFFLFITILITGLNSLRAEEQWRLEKDKNGIKIWTRKTPNSNLKEYKAISTFNVSSDKITGLFRKVSSYEKWSYKVEPGSVKIIKKISDNDFYLYNVIAAPLIKKRDVISHVRINSPDANGVILINMDAASDSVAEKEDGVRIKKMKAFFKITPLGNNKIQLEHQANSSPGGNIPDFMTNMGAVDAPFYMFEKIKELLGVP